MVKTSTFQDEQYNIYEAYAHLNHTVDATEAGNNAIEIASVEAHAVVIADEEYARGYANGVLSPITTVAYAAGPPAKTTVTFSSLTEGQSVDIYFPVTGTGCGNLVSNTNTGKLSLPRLQTIQKWEIPSNMEQLPECGTERKRPIEFSVLGSVTLGLNKYGNMAMADFIAARKGKSDGTDIFLLIDVVDTTVSPTTHDLLLQARARSYKQTSQASNDTKGIVTNTLTFSFVPDVVPLTET